MFYMNIWEKNKVYVAEYTTFLVKIVLFVMKSWEGIY